MWTHFAVDWPRMTAAEGRSCCLSARAGLPSRNISATGTRLLANTAAPGPERASAGERAHGRPRLVRCGLSVGVRGDVRAHPRGFGERGSVPTCGDAVLSAHRALEANGRAGSHYETRTTS